MERGSTGQKASLKINLSTIPLMYSSLLMMFYSMTLQWLIGRQIGVLLLLLLAHCSMLWLGTACRSRCGGDDAGGRAPPGQIFSTTSGLIACPSASYPALSVVGQVAVFLGGSDDLTPGGLVNHPSAGCLILRKTKNRIHETPSNMKSPRAEYFFSSFFFNDRQAGDKKMLLQHSRSARAIFVLRSRVWGQPGQPPSPLSFSCVCTHPKVLPVAPTIHRAFMHTYMFFLYISGPTH